MGQFLRFLRGVYAAERDCDASYVIERRVFVALLPFMLLTLWMSWRDIDKSMRWDRALDTAVIIGCLLTLQAFRWWLESREKTFPAGYAPFSKGVHDLIRDSFIFVTCYVSTFQANSFCENFGMAVALLIVAAVVKYRIYDDLIRYKIHDGMTVRHFPDGDTGHFMLRCILDQLPRAYLHTAFAFTILQLRLMDKPFSVPWTMTGGFAVNNPSGNPLADFFYFNIVTIGTVGYGDITPKSVLAKMLCSFEILFSLLILATILVTLLGKFQKIADQTKAANAAQP